MRISQNVVAFSVVFLKVFRILLILERPPLVGGLEKEKEPPYVFILLYFCMYSSRICSPIHPKQL